MFTVTLWEIFVFIKSDRSAASHFGGVLPSYFSFHYLFFSLLSHSLFLEKNEDTLLPRAIIDVDLQLSRFPVPDLKLFKAHSSGAPPVLINGAVHVRQCQPALILFSSF